MIAMGYQSQLREGTLLLVGFVVFKDRVLL